MLFDAHTHLFPVDVVADRTAACAAEPYCAALYGDPKARMADAASLLTALDAGQVDGALAVGFGWTTRDWCRRGNDALIAAAAAEPRLRVAVSVLPDDLPFSRAEVERAHAAGAVAIGELMPDAVGVPIDDRRWAGLFELAGELGMGVLVHGSEPVGHRYPGKGSVHPAALLAVAERYPETRFVFAHLGGGLPFYGFMPEVRQALRRNCWFDLAALPFLYAPGAIRAAADAVGADRLLFASDAPLLYPRRVVRQLELSGLATDDVLWRNAAVAYGFDAAKIRTEPRVTSE